MSMLKLLTLIAALDAVPAATKTLTATIKKRQALEKLVYDMEALTGNKQRVKEILESAKTEAQRRKELHGGSTLYHITEVMNEYKYKAMLGLPIEATAWQYPETNCHCVINYKNENEKK